MCECIEKVDLLLREHNTRLALTLVFGKTAEAYPTIATEQIEKGRGKPKAKMMFPTFCPFCAARYEAETVPE